jgi:hypothetical protein
MTNKSNSMLSKIKVSSSVIDITRIKKIVLLNGMELIAVIKTDNRKSDHITVLYLMDLIKVYDEETFTLLKLRINKMRETIHTPTTMYRHAIAYISDVGFDVSEAYLECITEENNRLEYEFNKASTELDEETEEEPNILPEPTHEINQKYTM